MTPDEFWELPKDNILEFTPYYGGKKYGILTGDPFSGPVYFIPKDSIREYNSGKSAKEVGTEINLASINYNRSSRASKVISSVQIVNPPTIRKLIILGAGASYDSVYGVDKDNSRPPLANNLFSDSLDHLLITYSGAYNLSSELAHVIDIEEFFQRKWERVMKYHDPTTLSKIINVQYYLHELFLSISKRMGSPKRSNYNMLIDLAHEYTVNTGEHVLFVSFNYDLLLEKAMQRTLKYEYSSINDYVDHHLRKLLLFKPHGSCNFIRRLDETILRHLPPEYTINSVRLLASLLYRKNIGYDIIENSLNGEFELFGYDEILNASDPPELSMYLPQILLPFKSKDDFVMPMTHSILLDTFLSNIDEIIVIGWKGTEQRFQNLLHQKLSSKEVKVTTVTNGDNSVKMEFEKSIPKAKYKADVKTFSEYIQYLMANNIELFG